MLKIAPDRGGVGYSRAPAPPDIPADARLFEVRRAAPHPVVAGMRRLEGPSRVRWSGATHSGGTEPTHRE